jgi:hypothetical protein
VEIDDALRVLDVERETWQILVNKVNQVRQSNQEAAVAFSHDEPRFSVNG